MLKILFEELQRPTLLRIKFHKITVQDTKHLSVKLMFHNIGQMFFVKFWVIE